MDTFYFPNMLLGGSSRLSRRIRHRAVPEEGDSRADTSHEHDLATLLRFERGHMAEEIVTKVFTAAGFTNFERQVEIQVDSEGAPLLVHIDFVFTSGSSKVKSILEVKSGSVPSTPYGSWESQLYAQMGALAEQYPDHMI